MAIPDAHHVHSLVEHLLEVANSPLRAADIIHFVYDRVMNPGTYETIGSSGLLPSVREGSESSCSGWSRGGDGEEPCPAGIRSSRLRSKIDEQRTTSTSSESNGLSTSPGNEFDPSLTLAALPKGARQVLEGLVCPPVMHTSSQMCQHLTTNNDDVMQTIAVHVLTYLRRRRAKRGELMCWAGRYFLGTREDEMTANLLITTAYQLLGLSVRRFGASYVMFVDPDAEHRFLAFGTSTLPGAGLGLFLRHGRTVRAGTVVCEYRGRLLPVSEKPSTHCVQLQNGDALDGLDEAGVVQSWAPLINDDGPARANVALHEFDEYPGQVFIITTRLIEQDEELFVEYGAKYWGAESYDKIRLQTGKVKSAPLQAVDGWSQTRCRDCDSCFPTRVKKLHQIACSDPLTKLKPLRLDPLPVNCFTAIDHGSQRPTKEAIRTATHFVSDHPFTQGNTYVNLDKL